MEMNDIENILKKNKIKCKCILADHKLKIKIENVKLAEKTKQILNQYLGLNKNYIFVELDESKVLKELYRMKNALNFEKDLVSLTKHHYSKSLDYKKIVDFLFNKKFNNLESLPFLPVKLFKDLNLKSIPDSEIFKVLYSSGTSGNVSKIF